MIYKFRFEVCSDDNKHVFAMAEESGKFWWAYTSFMSYIMNYVKGHRIDRE